MTHASDMLIETESLGCCKRNSSDMQDSWAKKIQHTPLLSQLSERIYGEYQRTWLENEICTIVSIILFVADTYSNFKF